MSGRPAPTPPTACGGHRVQLTLLAGALYGIVAVLAVRVRGSNSPLRVDRVVSRLVGSRRWWSRLRQLRVAVLWLRVGVRPLVSYGLPAAAVVLALGLAVLAWRRSDPRSAALCLVGPALAVVLTDTVLKPLVDRHSGAALAYPSGHATGAAAVATVVLFLLHRWGGWRITLRLAPLALALPVAMGIALVRLAFHYPTDVVGGTAMGAATVVVVAVLLDAQRTRNSQTTL